MLFVWRQDLQDQVSSTNLRQVVSGIIVHMLLVIHSVKHYLGVHQQRQSTILLPLYHGLRSLLLRDQDDYILVVKDDAGLYQWRLMSFFGRLIERAYIVADGRKCRTDNWAYRFHILLMSPYIIIFVLMMIYHNAIMTETGQCYIGLQPIANIPVLIFNLYMTILFVIPLIRVGRGVDNFDWKSSRLYDLTKRSLIASTVCLVASFANALSATILEGKQRGYLCMMCCTIDVTINVLTIHWVTNPPKSQHQTQGNVGDIAGEPVASRNRPLSSDSIIKISGSTTLNASHDYTTFGSATLYDHKEFPSSVIPDMYSQDNRSSLSIQDSQCSTKSLTKAPII
ncbi:hypothetical protein [Absidia glauca]|uniref:Uncharacterized protein n=1 Tax=Absidia glauca TaxID=4829 RepID=A0A163JCY7_ABSGL|nr:hypothetical protein [Absidia glauca]